MTSQAPMTERPSVEQPQAPMGAPVGASPSAPPVSPAAAPTTGYTGPAFGPMAGPAPGWYPVPVAAPQPASPTIPSPGMRLGLAIVSLVLFIPLLAIGIGSVSTLANVVAPWIALTVGLIIVSLVVLTIVAINLVFNYDLLKPGR